ncbi:tetratricopeptide repeat protein, partial [candidate division KSB1 bacterium]|nr:tetratricopeptide repeat protein [candidate division KSB1 bacterium]
IKGTGAQDFADELTTQLFQSGRYEVVDRQHFSQLLEEHKLSMTGLVDETTSAQVGKFLGSAAMIFGRVGQHEYSEEMKTSDYKDKDGKSHRNYARKGYAKVAITLQITDLETGKIIAIKNLDKTVTKDVTSTDTRPAEIDEKALLRDARERILTTFMRDIAPYTENERVPLLTDKELPQLKQGIGMAKIGNWDKAIEYFKAAIETAPGNSKTYFNLGVAYESTQDFKPALEYLQKAYDIEPKNTYLKEIARCQKLQQDLQVLRKQMQDAGM